LALTFLVGCGGEASKTSAPAPSGPAAAVQSNSYHGEGVVISISPKAPAIEINHGDIEGLMPGMQMEFPVTDASLLNGIAVNDRVDFTIENTASVMRITEIKKK
jgi:Cu/Ag efflux protein CusF